MQKRALGAVLGEVIARCVAAWFFAIALTLVVRPGDVSYIEYSIENLRLTVISGIGAFLVFTAASVFRYLGKLKFNTDFWGLLCAAVLLACVSSYKFMSIFYAVGAFFVLGAVALIAFADGKIRPREFTLGKKASLGVLLGGAVLVTGFVIAVSLVRYWSYYAPNYDFGIFANMFENLLKTGQPLTTCERDGLLSHFAVHISPIFYLLLPIYALVPRPETLLVIQAAAVVSGCVPVWFIARKKTGSHGAAAVFAALYMLYPAFSCGAFFDFHENKLLAPLILWALWFAEEKKRLPMYLFMLLTATVKEDAPVYIAVIGLYMFFGKKDRLHGAMSFFGAVAYFAGAVTLLSRIGEGAQLWRYDNIASGSLTAIIGAIFLNPMRVLAECVGEDKIKFIFQTLWPLFGLPLVCKRPARYFLLIPYVLVNLMPDYVYQHDIGFQYTYGSGALMIYLAILNWTDLRAALVPRFKTAAAAALVAAACLSFMSSGARGGFYFRMARENAAAIASISEALEHVPRDASVSASTMFVAHLADRPEVYDLDANLRLTEYIAQDLRDFSAAEAESMRLTYEALGYEEVVCNPYAAAVYRKNIR